MDAPLEKTALSENTVLQCVRLLKLVPMYCSACHSGTTSLRSVPEVLVGVLDWCKDAAVLSSVLEFLDSMEGNQGAISSDLLCSLAMHESDPDILVQVSLANTWLGMVIFMWTS